MKQRILVVDDEQQMRDLLAVYLKRHNFEVLTAETSLEALEVVRAQPVDLVVLDISLAGEDGLQTLVQIKNIDARVKIVMLTGMGFVEDLLIEAHERGADGYVSKVLPLDELLIAIRRAIHGRPERSPALVID